VAVIYAGRIVEEAAAEDLFKSHLHPYTQGLLRSIPPMRDSAKKPPRLTAIPGAVPNLLNLPRGCKFYPRCPRGQAICQEKEPSLDQAGSGHRVRCFFPG
jgi:oligopeptide/dipeptide ABC transporter ATP-binding protein